MDDILLKCHHKRSHSVSAALVAQLCGDVLQ